MQQQNSLYDFLHFTYFSIENTSEPKIIRKIIELLKSTIVQLIINDKSIERRKLHPSENDEKEQENILNIDNKDIVKKDIKESVDLNEESTLNQTILESDLDSD